jgi:SAM-dependent methyltransferase
MDTKKLPDLASFDLALGSTLVTVKFPLDSNSIRLAHIQTGNFIKLMTANSYDHLMANFAEYHSWQWQRCNQVGAWDLPENARILDLGSGLSVLDIILAQQRSDLRFWLIDRGVDTYQPDTVVTHGNDHPWYNSWITVEQQITANNLDRKRFVLQPPDGPWPSELDLILSTWCWCWHVPIETYLDSVLKSLAQGGRLCVDVRYEHYDSMVTELSKHMGTEPRVVSYYGRPWIKDELPRGYRCCWIRQ